MRTNSPTLAVALFRASGFGTPPGGNEPGAAILAEVAANASDGALTIR